MSCPEQATDKGDGRTVEDGWHRGAIAHHEATSDTACSSHPAGWDTTHDGHSPASPASQVAMAPTRPPELPESAPSSDASAPVRIASRLLRRLARWGDIALSVVVLAGLLAIGIVILPNTWGWRSYVVLTGSMEPTIPAGSVVVTRPTALDQLNVGDVISFARVQQPEVVITHRIVAVVNWGGTMQLMTKGDANRVADAWLVGGNDRVERVIYHVPGVGFLVQLASGPQVRALLILGALASLLLQVAINYLRSRRSEE